MNTAPLLTETEKPATIYSRTVDGQTFDFAQPTYKQVDIYRDKIGDDIFEAVEWFCRRLVDSSAQSAWLRAVKKDPSLPMEVSHEILDRIGLGVKP